MTFVLWERIGSQGPKKAFLWSWGLGSCFDYKDHIVLHFCGKCQTVDQRNNQERKSSHISVKVREILEFHTFKYCCEQERPKGVSAPKRWLMNSFGLHLWVPFPVPAAWWTLGKRTPVGGLASWYLGLLSKPTAASFVPPDLGVF